MKEQITMSVQEYKDQRETIEKEIKEQLEEEYKKVPVWTVGFAIFMYGILLPPMIKGYVFYPKLTMFTFTVAVFFYCFMVYQYVIMMKQHIKNA